MDADRLVRRLRGLSPAAWARGDRQAVVRALAVDLAAVGAPGKLLPDLPDYALADVIAVLAHDAAAADAERTAALVAAALDATR
jgi:hypothetical protein